MSWRGLRAGGGGGQWLGSVAAHSSLPRFSAGLHACAVCAGGRQAVEAPSWSSCTCDRRGRQADDGSNGDVATVPRFLACPDHSWAARLRSRRGWPAGGADGRQPGKGLLRALDRPYSQSGGVPVGLSQAAGPRRLCPVAWQRNCALSTGLSAGLSADRSLSSICGPAGADGQRLGRWLRAHDLPSAMPSLIQ